MRAKGERQKVISRKDAKGKEGKRQFHERKQKGKQIKKREKVENVKKYLNAQTPKRQKVISRKEVKKQISNFKCKRKQMLKNA